MGRRPHSWPLHLRGHTNTKGIAPVVVGKPFPRMDGDVEAVLTRRELQRIVDAGHLAISGQGALG